VNILRRLPISRLLLLCALVVAIGISATAIAFALGSGPTPPAKPLPVAVHDALSAAPVEGVTASVKLTDHLLEGASLASEGGDASGLSSSPLLSGASGRLWISKDGRVRLELQAEKGDTQVLYDGRTIQIYDAASNTLYRYTPPAHAFAGGEVRGTETSSDGSTLTTRIYEPQTKTSTHEIPSVAKIEEAIAKLGKHANLSGATPTDVAGQPAYTVRVSPNESGGLIGGAELSWDANNGVPLRAALYSSTSPSPVIELAASEISYGPVADSVFNFTPPANAKVEEVKLPSGHGGHHGGSTHSTGGAGHPTVKVDGHGISGVAVLESKVKPGEKPVEAPSELPKVNINGSSASELATALGTVLSFERSGVRYVLVGSVTPASIEVVARGL
jgi:outer membrane lipoprotein-sorting protein